MRPHSKRVPMRCAITVPRDTTSSRRDSNPPRHLDRVPCYSHTLREVVLTLHDANQKPEGFSPSAYPHPTPRVRGFASSPVWDRTKADCSKDSSAAITLRGIKWCDAPGSSIFTCPISSLTSFATSTPLRTLLRAYLANYFRNSLRPAPAPRFELGSRLIQSQECCQLHHTGLKSPMPESNRRPMLGRHLCYLYTNGACGLPSL